MRAFSLRFCPMPRTNLRYLAVVLVGNGYMYPTVAETATNVSLVNV